MRSLNFRYLPPKGPVAAAATGVGKVAITVRLTFDGELEVGWRRQGTRERADAEMLAVLLDGLLVSNLDKPTPAILTGPTHRFVQKTRVFQPPGTMVCRGECAVRIATEILEAQGILGYRLDITARWARRAPGVAAPDSASQWAEFFGASLASIGGIMLAGHG
jgi:hypothetical protein